MRPSFDVVKFTQRAGRVGVERAAVEAISDLLQLTLKLAVANQAPIRPAPPAPRLRRVPVARRLGPVC